MRSDDENDETAPESSAVSQDPLLAMRGSGRALWSDEHADQYVERLRRDWA
jgi:hypothetical protein